MPKRFVELGHDFAIQTDSVNLNLDDRGFITASATWKKSFPTASLTTSPRIKTVKGMGRGDAFPYNNFLGVECYCHRIGTTFHNGGFVEVICSYAGISLDASDGDRSQYRVEWICNAQTSPIETHNNFDPEGEGGIGGDITDPENGAQFDLDTGEFIGFPHTAPHKLGGVTDFYEPQVTCRISWVSRTGKDKVEDWIYKVGKITDPPKSADVPKLVGSRNYILTNFQYNFYAKGNDDQIKWEEFSLEFLLSQSGGWNSKIYDQS